VPLLAQQRHDLPPAPYLGPDHRGHCAASARAPTSGSYGRPADQDNQNSQGSSLGSSRAGLGSGLGSRRVDARPRVALRDLRAGPSADSASLRGDCMARYW